MDMGGQLMEVEVNGSENILRKAGRIQMCNYGKKMFSTFIVSSQMLKCSMEPHISIS